MVGIDTYCTLWWALIRTVRCEDELNFCANPIFVDFLRHNKDEINHTANILKFTVVSIYFAFMLGIHSALNKAFSKQQNPP